MARAEWSDFVTTKHQLLESCRAGKAAGMDFPTIWHEILKPHPLVMGPPISTVRHQCGSRWIFLRAARSVIQD